MMDDLDQDIRDFLEDSDRRLGRWPGTANLPLTAGSGGV
jgi:hypothetical protein